MLYRRCAHLMVELDHAPRFDVASLLSGGDGLDRGPRWLARAPHLPGPVDVTLEDLSRLSRLPEADWLAAEAVDERAGPGAAARLAGLGLLVTPGTPGADADQAARDLAWWTPALVAQAHGAWEGVDIEDRRERGLMPSSRKMVEDFGGAPDPEFVRAPGAPAMPLARPPRTGFDDLLHRRSTCRNFDPRAVLGAAEFATMLRRVWGVIGTRTLAPGAVALKKTSPAGGGLHAIEAYVLVQRVEGLAPGLYHYLGLRHALEPVQAMAADEARATAHRFLAGQDWFRDAPAMVVMVARFERLFWKYRRHAKAWRVVHLDAGHLSQTMYLSAADLGLGAFVTAAINDRDIATALGLPALREAAVALVGFGPRAAERKTLEMEPFDPVDPVAAGPRGD